MLADPFDPSTEVLEEERTRFAGLVGVGVWVPLGATVELLPELSYLWVPLSDDEVLGASSQSALLGTVALRFRFGR